MAQGNPRCTGVCEGGLDQKLTSRVRDIMGMPATGNVRSSALMRGLEHLLASTSDNESLLAIPGDNRTGV